MNNGSAKNENKFSPDVVTSSGRNKMAAAEYENTGCVEYQEIKSVVGIHQEQNYEHLNERDRGKEQLKQNYAALAK